MYHLRPLLAAMANAKEIEQLSLQSPAAARRTVPAQTQPTRITTPLLSAS